MSVSDILALSSEEKEALFEQLKIIYAELEEELDQRERPCTACGKCCHFTQAEHRLYASSLELAYLWDRHPHQEAIKEDRCPYQVEGQCSVRHERLIGCRTYYRLHQDDDRQAAEAAYEKALDKIKSILRKNNIDWEYRDLMSLFSKT